MKKLVLLCFALFASIGVQAHNFGPASMQNARGVNETIVVMNLKSTWSGFYSFSVGGKPLRDNGNKIIQKFVIEGMTAQFPFTIDNKYIKNDHVMICSWENRPDVMFKQEVCFNVKV
ncbi:hypothetical protein PP187_gp039 [Klebsiella phage vB_KvM-Eowyn]|uniref:Uncharacterized protein n=1 Tax=Klebsiella phage vB_KvM-Eowyn TaxID=2762819 RepID=A0A7R8R9D0_9CAUD|nr:hypothetical protein PP187_gp039 [Klebsiella phage vB_KvM-Eowyn]CAD5236028.1 hypothetical protein LLCLJKAH_00039 [Klebsiella phage vB_KvM-Eowyn]